MRGRRQGLGAIVIGLTCAALVAGCGASTAPGAKFAARTPAQILSAAVQAMAHAGSYRAVGMTVQGSAGVQLRVDAAAPANVAAFISTGGQEGRLVVLGPRGYLMANAAFWQSRDPSAPVEVTNRWFAFTAAQARGLAGSFLAVQPRTVATCLYRELRTGARVLGTTTVSGQQAVELEAGRASVAAKQLKLWVRTAAPHYPLRFSVDAGYDAPTTPGCASTLTGATGSENFAFSGFDSTHIAEPRGAFNLN